MGMPRAQVIEQDTGSVHLLYRDLRDVGFLIFQAAFLARGLLH